MFYLLQALETKLGSQSSPAHTSNNDGKFKTLLESILNYYKWQTTLHTALEEKVWNGSTGDGLKGQKHHLTVKVDEMRSDLGATLKQSPILAVFLLLLDRLTL